MDDRDDDFPDLDDLARRRLTPKQRLVRALNIGIVLALALNLFTGSASRLLHSAARDTSPRQGLRFSYLYVDLDVPWVTVSMDGHPLRVDAVGSGTPSPLSPGRHVISWSGQPFLSQSCVLTIPVAPADTCAPLLEGALPFSGGASAGVLHASESLSTVQPSARSALLGAIRAALAARDSSDTIQPGERYVLERSGVVTATASLRARLSFQLDANPSAALPAPCMPDAAHPASSFCMVETQYCRQLCALPWPLRGEGASSRPASEWLALAVYHSSWEYLTPDGLTAGGDSATDPLGSAVAEQRALLRVTWDGAAWHAQVSFAADLPAPLVLAQRNLVDDPACFTAEESFGVNESAQERSAYTRIRTVTGPDLAAGCALVATVATSSSVSASGLAVYLYRFGVLLAASDLAHHFHPGLPLATPAERQLALQLAALPGRVIYPARPLWPDLLEPRSRSPVQSPPWHAPCERLLQLISTPAREGCRT